MGTIKELSYIGRLFFSPFLRQDRMRASLDGVKVLAAIL